MVGSHGATTGGAHRRADTASRAPSASARRRYIEPLAKYGYRVS